MAEIPVCESYVLLAESDQSAIGSLLVHRGEAEQSPMGLSPRNRGDRVWERNAASLLYTLPVCVRSRTGRPENKTPVEISLILGCGGNSASPPPKADRRSLRSPAALLAKSRTQQKSFLFLLPARRSLGAGGEEKIGRAQIKKCEENFFAGWRALASGGGAERQNSQSGFSSKKVRILTKRRRGKRSKASKNGDPIRLQLYFIGVKILFGKIFAHETKKSFVILGGWLMLSLIPPLFHNGLNRDFVTKLLILAYFLLSLWWFYKKGQFIKIKNPRRTFLVWCTINAMAVEIFYMISEPLHASLLITANTSFFNALQNTAIDLILTLPAYLLIFLCNLAPGQTLSLFPFRLLFLNGVGPSFRGRGRFFSGQSRRSYFYSLRHA